MESMRGLRVVHVLRLPESGRRAERRERERADERVHPGCRSATRLMSKVLSSLTRHRVQLLLPPARTARPFIAFTPIMRGPCQGVRVAMLFLMTQLTAAWYSNLFGEAPPSDGSADLIVRTPFGNTRGVYIQQSSRSFNNHPVWVCAAHGNAIFHSPNGHWTIGTFTESSMTWQSFHSAARIGGKSPVGRLYEEQVHVIQASEIAPKSSGVPDLVLASSRFSNIPAGFKRGEDYLYYPTFRDDKTGMVLWHDIWDDAWVMSDVVGGQTYVWRVPSSAPHPVAIARSALLAEGGTIDAFEIRGWETRDDPAYGQESRLFTDAEFPPTRSSIGPVEGIVGGWLTRSAPVVWIRALNLNRDAADVLWRRVSPSDMQQGALGNCWLIAAIATAAKYPSVIQQCFRTQRIAKDGKYHMRLWDVRRGKAGEWVDIMVDDWMPCREHDPHRRHATPWFARSTLDGEIWPHVLEKAFAKFLGSYNALTNGGAGFAWQALTGCNPLIYERQPASATSGLGGWFSSRTDEDTWLLGENDIVRQRQKLLKATSEMERRSVALFSRGVRHSSDELFATLKQFDASGHLMAASIDHEPELDGIDLDGDGELEADDVAIEFDDASVDALGLSILHSFSILAVTEAPLSSYGRDTIRMIRLRNPWANEKQWSGAWSNNSSKWSEYPAAERHVERYIGGKRSREADGVFWMSWEDFRKIFTKVEVCKIGARRG